MHPALAANREDWHYVVMVQLHRGLGFGLKPLQLLTIQRCGERQHFQGHSVMLRELLGLVDDSHAAPADIAENSVIGESARGGGRAGSRSTGLPPGQR
jgi:hypothetical protein